MKNKILIILFILVVNHIYAQNFEGVIYYDKVYESKDPEISNEQLELMFGDVQKKLITYDGYYLNLYKGDYMRMQYYNPLENKLYTLLNTSDTLFYIDASVVDEEVISYDIEENKEIIDGLMCDLLIIKTENNKIEYYYNSQYSLDPNVFKDHNYGQWSFAVEQTNALPLKFSLETPYVKMTAIATQVNKMSVDRSVFNIPENAIIAPSRK